MEVTKSGLKQWKEKFFLIDRRAIPFHMPWRHPDSCITDKIPTDFNQEHVDRLKSHIVKLRDIPEGVRVVDHTTPPALVGTAIPRASPEEIAVTQPDRNVVAKADQSAKRKTSTRPKISTNTTKRTRLSQKVSGAGSSGLAAGDEVEQTDDGTLDDDDQRDGLEFAVEDVGNLNDVDQCEHINVIPLQTFDPSLGLDVTYPPILLPDKEVEAHAELSRDVRRTTRSSSHASHGVDGDASSPAQEAVLAPGTQTLDTDAGADEIASDGNVDSYFEARVSNTVRDALERDLLSFVPGPYYIPYPYDENNGFELSDHMSVLQCQLITHGHAFYARYDHSLREVKRLAKRWDKKHRKYRSERDTLAKEKAKIKEELKSRLKHRERQAKEIQGSITSFFQSDFTPLVRRFLKSSEFSRVFVGVLNTAISVGVECGLRMVRTDEEFRGLSHRVVGFIPDAKEKFDRVIAAFPDTTFPFLDK
ncbi:hypothetical protein Tco_0512646, partial [Tanacetum coccineum]